MNQNTVSGNLDRIKRATDDMRLITGTTGEDIETVAQAVSDLNDDNLVKDETIAELEQKIEDITPVGNIDINTNGLVDVTKYKYADVNIKIDTDIYKVPSKDDLKINLNRKSAQYKKDDIAVATGKITKPFDENFVGGTLIFPVDVYLDGLDLWNRYDLDIMSDNTRISWYVCPADSNISLMIEGPDFKHYQYNKITDTHYQIPDLSEPIEIEVPVGADIVYEDIRAAKQNVWSVTNSFDGIYQFQTEKGRMGTTNLGNNYFTPLDGAPIEFLMNLRSNGINTLSSYVSLRSYSNNTIFYLDGEDLHAYNNGQSDNTIQAWYVDVPSNTSQYKHDIWVKQGQDVNLTETEELEKEFLLLIPTNSPESKARIEGELIDYINECSSENYNLWEGYDIGINTSEGALLSGRKGYSNRGVITGALGDKDPYIEDYTGLEAFNRLGNQIKNSTTEVRSSDLGFQNTYFSTEAEDIQSVLDNVRFKIAYDDYSIQLINFHKLKYIDLTRQAEIQNNCGQILAGVDASSCEELEKIVGFDAFGDLSSSKFRLNLRRCPQLYYIDGLSNIGEVSKLSIVVTGCDNLTELDFSNLTCPPQYSYDAIEEYSGRMNYLRTIKMPKMTFDLSRAGTFSMFVRLNSLEVLDIRGGTFNNCTFSNRSFSGVPDNCLIIVKDNSIKSRILSTSPNLTNVQTVEEYEGGNK